MCLGRGLINSYLPGEGHRVGRQVPKAFLTSWQAGLLRFLAAKNEEKKKFRNSKYSLKYGLRLKTKVLIMFCGQSRG